MRYLLFALILFLSPTLFAQEIADSVFWVYLTDKDENGYQIDQPDAFLSRRSIDRRAWQGLGIDRRDLPVNGNYVQEIRDMGVQVKHISRWLNGIAMINATEALYRQVLEKSFTDTLPWFPETDELFFPPRPGGSRFAPPLETAPEFEYGVAMEQVTMLKMDHVHQLGYTGKGVWIAVLDAGFKNVDSLPSFELMIEEGRLLGTRNFVNDEPIFRQSNAHGMNVLSTMGGEWNGYMVGTAPHASYLLCMTENVEQETRIEEIAWIEAAEFADSLGFDISNTSLGYSDMDGDKYDYSYSDMDGKTTFISRAASLAASRGMIAVNSAGNEGSHPWYYITAPADARDIFTVGAVDSTNEIAAFSSRGPTYDARIKPDVTAMGVASGVQYQEGGLARGSGTSFSSPILAGSVASLWQAYPELTAREMIHLVRQGGDRVKNPDSTYGFGLPNFFKTYWSITGVPSRSVQGKLEIYPNPARDMIMIKVPGASSGMQTIRIYDISGRMLHALQAQIPGQVALPGDLSGGIYILVIHTISGVYHSNLIVE
ncbi:MAG: S8 family serine peptidase [Bacteroidota bacterium]